MLSKKMILILLILTFLFFYYCVFFEPSNIKINSLEISFPNLPPEFEDLKIIQISDLHSLWYGNREKRVLKTLKETPYDFLFITGDFVDKLTRITDPEFKKVKPFWEELGKLGKVFAVFGNQDHKKVQSVLKETKIKFLENSNVAFSRGGKRVVIVGTNDPRTKQANIKEAFRNVNSDDFVILLSHAPDILAQLKGKKADLILVGDTHGGQVNIPILNRIFLPLTKYGQMYPKGLFKVDSSYLYVNPGIGTSFFPIRFFCQPEITIFSLKRQ